MKAHIIRLFNGLLAINIVFVLYLIMHDFDSANTRVTRSQHFIQNTPNDEQKPTLSTTTKILANVPKNITNSEMIRLTNTDEEGAATKRRNEMKRKTKVEFMENDNNDIVDKNKNTKINGEQGNRYNERFSGRHAESKNTQFKEDHEELMHNIELLFPNNLRTHKTKNEQINEKERIQRQYNFKPKETRKKLILLYYYDRVTTDDRLKQLNCHSKQCHFSRAPSDFDIADAVLFKEIPRKLTRPRGKPHQIWVYVQLESPVHTKLMNEEINNEEFLFNWTATYRLDSTIPTPYEIFQPFKNNNNNNNNNNNRLRTREDRNYARGKTKLVAWFVSNCLAKNNRLEYAKELQKYIPVDIYGHCGPLKCPSARSHSCQSMLKRDYKFYLAFENSNCKGYVTEKFFNALRNDVIPIVMGAHPDEYTSLAPPQSFIHVNQFKSVEQLANYLNLLDSNDHLYNSYFKWKGTGDFADTKFMCRICSMLDIAPRYPVWYNSVSDWWKKDTCLARNETWQW